MNMAIALHYVSEHFGYPVALELSKHNVYIRLSKGPVEFVQFSDESNVIMNHQDKTIIPLKMDEV